MGKLNQLTIDWGFDSPEDMVEHHVLDGLMPSICMNRDCDYSTEYEPDQDRGWCENCCTNTVKSAAILMGVI